MYCMGCQERVDWTAPRISQREKRKINKIKRVMGKTPENGGGGGWCRMERFGGFSV
jgi:hypothetical protein